MSKAPVAPNPSSAGWRVWGHDAAVRELQSAITTGVRHAYILSGYHHVGKEALALEFARALVCLDPPATGLSCGDCSSCRRVSRGTFPDVTTYDLARQQDESSKSSTSKHQSINIETVRAISSSVSLRPMEARHRVVIVEDVETMQETAQEAFLKTLEEPPSYVVILLLTTDADLMLETIRSRCTTIQLQTVRAATIANMLEDAGIQEDDARTIAAASVGRPGWAIKAANDPSLLTARLELQSAVASWITGSQYECMIEATRLGDAFSKDRAAVFARLSVAQTIWRGVMFQALGIQEIDAAESSLTGATAIAPEGAVEALRSVERCFSDLDSNVRPRLALQSMVLRWPELPR